MDLTQWVPPTPIDEDKLKRLYAAELHTRPDTASERFNAARLLFPLADQIGLCLEVATKWIDDPIVIAERDRLKISGAADNLPSKADIARRIINIADDLNLPPATRLSALNQYSELMDMKPIKGAVQAPVVNYDQRRVYVLPQPRHVDDWESIAVAQQAKLVDGNARRA